MTIIIDGKPLQKRIVNGIEVEKVIQGGVQVRPDGGPTPPTPTGGPLCFTANVNNSSVALNKYGNPAVVQLEISRDKINWTDYTIGDTINLLRAGDKIYRRNKSETDTTFSLRPNDFYYFIMDGSISGSGSITTLLNKNGTLTISIYGFNKLFENCTSLTTAPSLPATNLAEYCYEFMFKGCTSLTTAPSLPATNLAMHCYYSMFYGCTSLITLPSLSATNLAPYCYEFMFKGCTGIKLSSSQEGEYQTPYRIPTTGTGQSATDATKQMFIETGGTFHLTPNINTTYYTSNTLV